MKRPEYGHSLLVIDLDTGKATRLSERPAFHPCWLDEETVAYLWRDTLKQQTVLFAVNTARNVTTPLATFDGFAEWPAVHPDRKRLAVVLAAPGGGQRIVLRDLERNTDETFAEGSEFSHLRWLPDGSALSWSGPDREGGAESNGIWVKALGAGAPARQIVRDGFGPVWNADGTVVYFARIREGSGLWRYGLKDGRAEKLRAWTEVEHFDLVGPRLLYCQVADRSVPRVYSIALN